MVCTTVFGISKRILVLQVGICKNTTEVLGIATKMNYKSTWISKMDWNTSNIEVLLRK